jgi:aryl-alcohol dehydrogenase-like predicted oxidoreductase
MTTVMPVVPLGVSGIPVSRLALGSWRTFERIDRDRGVSVMTAARDAGITFLDDARYNDETGQAPLPSGYSEVIFGELFRAAGWNRADTVVANKLWWEFWPGETPAQELAGSLRRMRFEYIDLIYSDRLPDGVPVEDAVGMIGGLITAGHARAWGAFNWPPDQLEQAFQAAERAGVPGPSATQPAYSLVRRELVDDPALQRLVASRYLAIVASYTLAGGILTGKYDQDPEAGRAAGTLDSPQWASAVAAGRELAALARAAGRDPASLAMAFALLNPSVAAVLFGSTRPEQVTANVAALSVAQSLSAEERARLTAIGASALRSSAGQAEQPYVRDDRFGLRTARCARGPGRRRGPSSPCSPRRRSSRRTACPSRPRRRRPTARCPRRPRAAR